MVSLRDLRSQHGEGTTVLAHGDQGSHRRTALTFDLGGNPEGLPSAQQPGELGALLAAIARGPHRVLVVDGGTGGGAAVRDGERAVVLLDPQHEIGAQKIGQQVPIADEVLQPVGLLLGETTIIGEELGQARHGDRIGVCVIAPVTVPSAVSSSALL